MTYLKEGETLRSRLDQLLAEARGNRDRGLKEEILAEASVVAMLLRADEDAAFHAASLGDELAAPLPHWLGEAPDIMVDYSTAIAEPRYTEQDIRRAHEVLLVDHPAEYLESTHSMFMATLHDLTTTGPTESLGRIYVIPDDPRLDDTVSLDVKGGDPTPNLPTEQLPATDPEPSTDVEFDTAANELSAVDVIRSTAKALGVDEALIEERIDELSRKEAEPVRPLGEDYEDTIGHSRYEDEISPRAGEDFDAFDDDFAPVDDADARADAFIAEHGTEPKKPRQAPKSAPSPIKKLQDKKKGRSSK